MPKNEKKDLELQSKREEMMLGTGLRLRLIDMYLREVLDIEIKSLRNVHVIVMRMIKRRMSRRIRIVVQLVLGQEIVIEIEIRIVLARDVTKIELVPDQEIEIETRTEIGRGVGNEIVREIEIPIEHGTGTLMAVIVVEIIAEIVLKVKRIKWMTKIEAREIMIDVEIAEHIQIVRTKMVVISVVGLRLIVTYLAQARKVIRIRRQIRAEVIKMVLIRI